MNRLHTMSRFAEPDEDMPVQTCDYCNNEMYEGEEAYEIGGDIYCSVGCLIDSGVITVITIEKGE
jgi:hypothetical protein